MPDGSPPFVLRSEAPAKINLTLEVLGKRNDGYHDLRSVFQTLALGDDVSVTVMPAESGGVSVSVEGPFAAGTPADGTNLACRAVSELRAITGGRGDVHIVLEKRVPPAGGLGGGASDAATVLRLLQRAWRQATQSDLIEAANRIGSDEAAFVLGGTVDISGRGEVVAQLPNLPAHDVVLFIPRETIPAKTGRMFAAIDQTPFDDGVVTSGLIERLPAELDGMDIYNAFERVAYDLFPGLPDLWSGLEGRLNAPVHLAGAGPTLFWLGRAGQGEHVADLARGIDCTVIATRTADSLWRR
ncbi:hypothetical protein AYO38_11650 [bacterium SCGC AG-212-C10]|nr:hypothetical protein AYO38_11650 [bacterium SCGC AG-212-C10]